MSKIINLTNSQQLEHITNIKVIKITLEFQVLLFVTMSMSTSGCWHSHRHQNVRIYIFLNLSDIRLDG